MMSNNAPIRVLHVIGGMDIGGAETMIMNIYRAIDRKRIQFDFLCMQPGKHYYDTEIESLGGRIIHIDAPHKTGVFQHSLDIIKVIKKYGEFDAIHVHTMHHAGIVLTVARILGVKIRISHSHSTQDIKMNSKIRKLYFSVMKKLIKINATHMIGCGEAASKYLFGEKCVNKNKVDFLANAIDLEPYNTLINTESDIMRKELNISKETLVIGHIGRFVDVKNHQFFIPLAKGLLDKNIDFHIILVGEGILREKFEELVSENNLEEYITCLGIRRDIPQIANMIDVFVLPSFYEGFPVVMAEMQAAGNPCVVSNKVSEEVELGLALVKFVGLNTSIETWIDTILSQYELVTPPKSLIMSTLGSKGYDIKKSIERLKNIYESR